MNGVEVEEMMGLMGLIRTNPNPHSVALESCEVVQEDTHAKGDCNRCRPVSKSGCLTSGRIIYCRKPKGHMSIY